MIADASRNGPPEGARRYLAAWFPFLPTDRLRRRPGFGVPSDAPFALIEKVGGALRLLAVDRKGREEGLVPGLTLADARARTPGLAAMPADTRADAEFLKALAEACDRFSPAVALDPPDGLLLDVTGCAHLFGGEAALQGEVMAHLRRFGAEVRIALAGTPDGARALARFADRTLGQPEDEAACLRQLPVAALGVDAGTIQALLRAGLRTIADLDDRPSTILASRFGETLIRSLGRTLGREDRRITTLRPLPACRAERRFAEPLMQRDGLEMVLDHLVVEVARQLEARGAGGRVFVASFFRSDGATRRVAVETGRAIRDAGALRRLCRERLDALADPLDPGFGFDGLRLAVPVIEPLEMTQIDFGGGAALDDALGNLLDRLAARFGRDRVQRFVPRDTHDPDREARRVPALDVARISHPARWPEAEPGEPPLRPILWFDPPQPIDVMAEVPDGPPARFRRRRVLHDVALAEGPERIAPEWWRQGSERGTRDYYRVEDTEGRRFWVFRRGLYGETECPRWFLHGLFS